MCYLVMSMVEVSRRCCFVWLEVIAQMRGIIGDSSRLRRFWQRSLFSFVMEFFEIFSLKFFYFSQTELAVYDLRSPWPQIRHHWSANEGGHLRPQDALDRQRSTRHRRAKELFYTSIAQLGAVLTYLPRHSSVVMHAGRPFQKPQTSHAKL